MGIKLRQVLPLLTVKNELSKKMKAGNKLTHESKLSRRDQLLIRQIKERTNRQNLNNVTRTMTYYEFYRRHPEIHWAFLGHMVSRNGGWNMTDIKGELLSRLLSEAEQKDFFLFLERGNWLIFQDVYPQFLLYEESVRRETNLFYLLPYFHVSVFMDVMWNHIWKAGDRYLLAMALIINEQSYLEKRVIQHPRYQKTVLQTIEFKLQDLLGLNQILFPCYKGGTDKELHVIGQTLRHFASLQERIRLGKRLYSLLFGRSDYLQGALNWAADHPHTGSRKDYWPHLFNDVNDSVPGTLYVRRLKNCQLQSGTNRFYSPTLEHAWKNQAHEEAEIGDWYRDWKVIASLMNDEETTDGEIRHEYCKTLEKIELAVMAQTAIFER
ncbi:DUF2515 domain-containing protein [Brevibacillus sp. H7]|uniref:DUF2515 domain-containing protein n=1 Tax=Brevibacillus sp. H7 TaxID=3349138 RepID=UPI0037FD0293